MNEKDISIIEKIKKRDEKALFLFYQEYKKPLYNFILRSIKDKDDADEILQDSFFSFIEALRDFRGQSSLKTFLYSIAKNKVIDKIRKKKIKRLLFSHLPQGLIESMASILMDDELDKKILAKNIESVFSKLPNDYATVLRLKYKEGYKVAEIAELVKLSFKATESLIFRARKAFLIAYQTHERQTLSATAKAT